MFYKSEALTNFWFTPVATILWSFKKIFLPMLIPRQLQGVHFLIASTTGVKLTDPHSQILSMQLKREQPRENLKRVLSFLTQHAPAAVMLHLGWWS